jgi:hypothetical protein
MPRAVRRWPVLVPLVWFLAIMAVMRPDAIAGRDAIPWELRRLVYVESDFGAMALRGANSHMGRLPGRPDEPEWAWPEDVADRLDAPQPGYEPRYYLEYPTAALGLFRLGFLIQPSARELTLPPAVADGQQFAIGFFVPRSDEERRVWSRLGDAVRFYIVVGAAGLVGLLLVVGRGYEPGGRWGGPLWLAVLPGAVFFSLNRYDILPALATALGFFCLGRGHRGWAGAWLAVGVALKLYPVLFVPIILRYLGPRASLRFLVGFAIPVVAAAGLSLLLLDREGTLGPLKVQLSRPLEETSWTLYGRLLPLELGRGTLGRQVILLLAIAAVSLTRPLDVAAVLRRCGLVLVVFVLLAVFWSPQWVVWFLPLVVPLARRRWAYVYPAVALDVLNYYTFPILFWIHWQYFPPDVREPLAEVLVYARTAAWLGLAGVFAWDWYTSRTTVGPHQAFHAGRSALVEAFRRAAESQNRPRGVEWVTAEPVGEPVFVTDSGIPVALVPVEVAFRPRPGSELEDVPQAREPRTVTAMFTFENGAWRTTGRAIFNLTPAEVIARGGGRFAQATSQTTTEPVSPAAATRSPSGEKASE